MGALVESSRVLLLLLFVAAWDSAMAMTLAWDPPAGALPTGYMLYYGPAPGSYTVKVDVGNVTKFTVPNLVEGDTYHFAATDYDATYSESGFSNDVAVTVPFNSPVANYQGLWWKSPGGSEDGWGINFAHQGKTIFGTWFTYDTTGKGWWLTLITDDSKSTATVFQGNLFATTGPPFNTVPFVKTGPPPPRGRHRDADLHRCQQRLVPL